MWYKLESEVIACELGTTIVFKTFFNANKRLLTNFIGNALTSNKKLGIFS